MSKNTKNLPTNTKKRLEMSMLFVAVIFSLFWPKMVPEGGGGGLQKTQKNAQNRVREISWFRPALRERFWMDSGRFGTDFG